MEADFSGYATKNGLKCSDGRTIMADAFKHQDSLKVPLVWQHQINEPSNILGYAILENRPDGVYTHGYFNESDSATQAKQLIQHGDVNALSIFAKNLVEKGRNVIHGDIREVSLVVSGANPGALIDNVNIMHSDGEYETVLDEAVIFTGLTLEHEDKEQEGEIMPPEADTKDKTIQDVYDEMNEEQKTAVHIIVEEAVEDALNEKTAAATEEVTAEHSEDDNQETTLQHNQEGTDMSRNVFERNGSTLQHDDQPRLTREQISTIFKDAEKMGSFKDSFLAHAEDYGITNIEVLFPDATNVDKVPEWITRKMAWVGPVLNGVRKLPYSRIKSRSADLTHEEARAKGYIKASVKKEQFFTISHRETTPATIYKKQKLDRDDIIDITEFDVVQWIWQEMRFMLNEEIARAILIGDGREIDDEDKINETKIRPIALDDEFYTDVLIIAANLSGDAVIEAILRGRVNYKGSGNPSMFTTEEILTDLILLKDKMGRRLYPTQAELESALRVKEIVTVPVMEGAQTDDGELLAIFVNLADYSIGTDQGGQITTFDQFDIDYNQYKYLIEGRMSGALTEHKTAQVLVRANGTLVTPTVPSFVTSTGVVTIPTVVGVTYQDEDGDDLTAGAQTAIDAGETVSIYAVPNTGYYFPHNFDADWDFTRDA